MMRRTGHATAGAPASLLRLVATTIIAYGGAMRWTLPLLLSLAIVACGGTPEPARTAARTKPAGPRLIRFEYRDAQRQLVITARDRAGQVIGLQLDGPIVLMADGMCGLGGRRNGEATRFVLPARRLTVGRYDFTVRLTSSSCSAHARLRKAASKVTLTVASDGSATAKDSRGRRLS
jgi:hypothetical protein